MRRYLSRIVLSLTVGVAMLTGPLAQAATLPLDLPLRFDFGSSDTASGWIGIGSGVTYNGAVGYGFSSSVSTATGGSPNDPTVDPNTDFAFHASTAKAFWVDLGVNDPDGSVPGFNAPGDYFVTVTVERHNLSHSVKATVSGGAGSQDLILENDASTNPSVSVISAPVTVLADQRLVILMDAGPNAGSSGFAGGWIVNSIVVEAVPEPASLGLLGLGSLLLLPRRR